MSARSIHGPLALFLGAVKSVLRELPRDGTGLRVDPTPAGHVTVTLLGPDGPLATCVVAQRAVPRGDGRQLTIDDVLARGAKPAAPAPAADTPPAAPARFSATVADDRGADLGEDGREYPDGPPYAELRIVRSDWQRYRRALGDVVGGAHQGSWMPDGDHRTLTVSRSQYGAIRAAMLEHPGAWGKVEVALLGDEPPAPTPLWVAASEWEGLDAELRAELGAHVLGDWRREGDWYTATPYEDAGGYVYDKLCREGVAVRLDPPPAPAPAKKPAKGKLYRDQGHALDRPHAHPNVAYLAGPNSDMERPKGLDDAAWRALVAQTVAGAPAATWRLYSAKGKCLWDSRDGGAP